MLQVQAGWGGHARIGSWMPIRVAVTNVTEPVSGYLELLRDRAVETATPVELTPGAPKRYVLHTIFQTVNQFSPGVTMAVRLRQRRKILARASVRVRPLDPESRLLLTLTDDGTGLKALEGQSVDRVGWEVERSPQQAFGERVVRTAHASPADAPELWNSLDPVDLLVVTGAAWAAMSSVQRRAIRRWIESGGRAIACGERPEEWADVEGRRLVPDRSARRGRPPCLPRRRGFGVVTWLGLDPFRSTVRLSPEYRRLWSTWIRRTTGAEARPRRLGSLLDSPRATEIAGALPQMPAPSRGLLAGIALAYVLVFGPLNVWVLRRLRRTVAAWLFLPALSVGMTGILLLLGGAWARGQTLLNRLVVIEAMDGAATGWEESLAGLFSPANRTFGVTIDDPCVGLRLEAPEAGMLGAPVGGREPGLLVPMLQTDTQSRWESLPVTLWSLHYEAYGRPTDLEGVVGIEMQARQTERPEGTVRNQLRQPLRRAYLQFRGYRHWIGDLAPGAAHRVQESGWSLRRLGQSQAGTPAYDPTPEHPPVDIRASRGYPSDRRTPVDGRPPSTTGTQAAADPLHEEASVLLRPGGREDEAVLVAELPAYRTGARIDDVIDRAPYSLLIVRTVVRPSR